MADIPRLAPIPPAIAGKDVARKARQRDADGGGAHQRDGRRAQLGEDGLRARAARARVNGGCEEC
eukprot:8161655-Pyramimonas_sp.AAC.1